MDRQIEKATTLLVIGVIFLHLKNAPFTKVEESFNLQATHDVLASGVKTSDAANFLKENYDHVEFPGSVPRTFIGAIALTLATSTVQIVGATITGLDGQMLVRGLLGLANAASIIGLRNAISHTFGSTAAVWYMLLQTSQFHLMYYASRTLPNMFAFALTTLALKDFVYALNAQADKARAWYRECLFLLTIAGVVFRAEIAVLVFSLSAFLAGINPSSIRSVIIPAGALGALSGIFATVIVDSYFWQRVTWPELEGFYYNTILGKSSDWGVSPPDYYFTNALPKLMLNPITYLLLIPNAILQPATRSRSLALLLPSLTFVFVYSFLPHKEWRFIIYIIPALTVVAAASASWIWTRRSKSKLYRILAAILVFSTVATFMASAALSGISSLNYPGGVAVMRLHEMAGDSYSTVRVHADNLACQTGLSRFLEDRTNTTKSGRPRWIFDKTDTPEKLLDPLFWDQFDYAIVENPERTIGKFEVVSLVRGYAGVSIRKPGQMLDDRKWDERFVNGRMVPLDKWQDDWNLYGEWLRGYTGGWWFVVKMEPRLRILRKQKSPPNLLVDEV